MFHPSRPSKQLILDAAGMLPDNLDVIKKKIDAAIDKISKLPNPIKLSKEQWKYNGLKMRLNTPDPKDSYKKIVSDCIDVFINLIEATNDLYSLANEKRLLKEDSRHRDETIKTGDVKKKIDKLLSDDSLIELANKLEKAYSEFKDISVYMLSFINYTVRDVFDYKDQTTMDNFFKIYNLIHNPLKEEKSIWLHTVMSKCIGQRNNFSELYEEYLEGPKTWFGNDKFIKDAKKFKETTERKATEKTSLKK